MLNKLKNKSVKRALRIITSCMILAFLFFSSQVNFASVAVISKIEDGGGGYNDWYGELIHIDFPENTPNPCYSKSTYYTSCYPHLLLRKRDGTYTYLAIRGGSGSTLDISKKETLAEVKAHMLTYYPPIQTFDWRIGASITYVCMGFGYGFMDEGTFRMELFPQEACRPIPPMDLVCTLIGDHEIKHNEVLSDHVDSYQSQIQLAINCNQDATLRVNVFGFEKNIVSLRPDDSLQSYLSINDKEGHVGDVINVNAHQNKPIRIDSVLKAHGKPSTGPFHGSAILIVLYE